VAVLHNRTSRGPGATAVAVRAALFDLDDTLFDHQFCAQAALGGVRALHPCFAAVDPLDLERTHGGILERLHLEVIGGRLSLDTARVERFRQLFATAGVAADDALAGKAARAYREGYIAARVEVEGASALLAAVRQHVPVVVVSNNLLAEQQAKMRHCGLDRLVDHLVVSEEAGVSKPDPGIFELALTRAGVRPDEAVMVGDSWANDIEGARRAGIRPIWFNRGPDPAPDPTVTVIDRWTPVDDVLPVILGW
jgi:HAD superfamily hydrolase (TIGR01549 family)